MTFGGDSEGAGGRGPFPQSQARRLLRDGSGACATFNFGFEQTCVPHLSGIGRRPLPWLGDWRGIRPQSRLRTEAALKADECPIKPDRNSLAPACACLSPNLLSA